MSYLQVPTRPRLPAPLDKIILFEAPLRVWVPITYIELDVDGQGGNDAESKALMALACQSGGLQSKRSFPKEGNTLSQLITEGPTQLWLNLKSPTLSYDLPLSSEKSQCPENSNQEANLSGKESPSGRVPFPRLHF